MQYIWAAAWKNQQNGMCARPAKTQISLGSRLVWSESSVSAWRKLGSLATHWAHSEDFDQTGRMPRLIWVFAGRTVILLVLSCRSSFTCIYSKPPECQSVHGYGSDGVHYVNNTDDNDT